jgi:AcrR family transcriptional regulator
MEEAAKALNRRGVSKTSLAEIAENVGISRAALYYYFDDQEDLVFQCYRRSVEQMARRLNDASHRSTKALDIIDDFIEGMLSKDEPEFAVLTEVAFLRPEQRSTIFGLFEGLRSSLAHILQEGAKRKELRACKAALVAPAIVGLITGTYAIRHWRAAAAVSTRDLIDAAKLILHGGIAVDRKAPGTYQAIPISAADLPAGRVFDAEAMAAARQEALLAAASWLFNLKGVDATSLEEIALRVGVTKKVIYHNMGDKQALVVQCHRRGYRFFESVVAQMEKREGPRIEAICACVEALAAATIREDIAPLPLVTGHEALPAAEREKLQEAALRLSKTHVKMLTKGQREGNVRPMNKAAVVSALPGLIGWLPRWFDALSVAERAAAPRELAELYRIGLRRL